MISHRGISVITPLPSGEGSGEGPLPHMGISVITPLPFGGGVGGGAAIFLTFVGSVHLCFSVRKRTHPPCEKERLRFAGEFYLSQSAQSSLSIFAHSFELTERLRHTENTERYC